MRHIPRKSAVVSIAAVLTMGVSATAFGQGNTDQTSEMAGSIAPSLQDNNNDAKASLFTQVTTQDTNDTPFIPAEPAEVVRIDFPGEVDYKVNGKLAKCDPDAGTFATDGTDDAVNACRGSLIGAGTAFARIPGYPLDGGQAELTVAAFNGQTSEDGEQDSTDVPTGGFDGGNPTIILHADNAVLPTTLVLGEVRPSPNGAAYGDQLNVTDATDVAEDAGALVLFNAQVQRSWTNGKSGNKKKTYNLVNATCDDAPQGDGDYDFQTTWTYDDATVDTFGYFQDCTEK